jgi:hypothetical protein
VQWLKFSVQSELHESVPPASAQKSSHVQTSAKQPLLSIRLPSHSSPSSSRPLPQRLAFGVGVGAGDAVCVDPAPGVGVTPVAVGVTAVEVGVAPVAVTVGRFVGVTVALGVGVVVGPPRRSPSHSKRTNSGADGKQRRWELLASRKQSSSTVHDVWPGAQSSVASFPETVTLGMQGPSVSPHCWHSSPFEPPPPLPQLLIVKLLTVATSTSNADNVAHRAIDPRSSVILLLRRSALSLLS